MGLSTLGLLLFVGMIIASTGSSDTATNTSNTNREVNADQTQKDRKQDRDPAYENWNPGGQETEKAKRRQEGRRNNPLSD